MGQLTEGLEGQAEGCGGPVARPRRSLLAWTLCPSGGGWEGRGLQLPKEKCGIWGQMSPDSKLQWMYPKLCDFHDCRHAP
jgi:hypothetical protein